MLALMLPFGLAFGGLAAIGAVSGIVAAVLWRRQAAPRQDRGAEENAAPTAAAISSLADDLAEAVNRNEFFLVHQPKMRARSGEVQAVETLIRWRQRAGEVFVSLEALMPVLQVLVPTILYVVGVATIGIYVSSALYIALFMIWQGKFRWWLAALVAIGVPVALFLLFEVWFLIPLPKGPLEHLLGY